MVALLRTCLTREHNLTRVFEELARLDMFRFYHHARQNMACERFDAYRGRIRPHAQIFHAQILSNFEPARYMRSVIVYYQLIII